VRTLTEVIRTEASGDQTKPVEIYDLFLDAETLHFAQYTQNVTFYDLDGVESTYIAMPIEREGAKSSSDLSINNITVRMANIDRSMSAYLASNEFRSRRIVIRKLFMGVSNTSGDAVRIFDGLMDAPAADEKWLSISAADRIGSLQKECPKRWYQLLCNWQFGSTECGIDLSSVVNSGDGAVDSATATVITDAGLPNSGSGDNYWKNGYAIFTSGNLNRARRRISANTASTFTVDTALLEAPANGDEYMLLRNCDQTLSVCSGDFANMDNFGGFSTIPEQMVLR